ncbi:PD-(D/E)XK nuclease family protein [bacterium]|nr:PD-(D/E)XK nuclease family protein [bacterium]NUN44428.1 PD-(D/E)XK nuclease family protein [bacterium]
MNAFLDDIATYLLKDSSANLNDRCVIFQNQRAKLYFKKYVGQRALPGLILPEMLTIEELAERLSGKRITDNFDLLIELYLCHQKLNQPETFIKFYDLGLKIIEDFSDMDMYAVDPAKLFINLDYLKSTEFWDKNDEDLTALQLRQKNFWKYLFALHNEFKRVLEKKGKAYAGMAYREAANQIRSHNYTLPWSKVFFAGINALSLCEEEIIDHLLRRKQAEIFWDADVFYINQKHHEAGNFIRRYIKKWSETDKHWIGDRLSRDNKTIRITRASQNSAQARAAIIALKESVKNKTASIAVVLGDESLLIPVLEELPESLTKSARINVSMGYPLSMTTIYSFMMCVLQLHADALSNQTKRKEYSFLNQHVIQFFSLSLVRNLIKDKVYAIHEAIIRQNSTKISSEFIQSLTKLPSLKLVFNACRDISHMIENINTLIDEIKSELFTNRMYEELEALYLWKEKWTIICETYQRYTSLHNPVLSENLETIIRIMQDAVNNVRIPFNSPAESSNLTHRIEIMGMLETRALDFEHVIILSVNEGVFPAPRSTHSLIPFTARAESGMPNYTEKESIFAYNFYRLLQRASTIDLIYDAQINQNTKGEPSRFIQQLRYELAKTSPSITIIENELSPLPVIKSSIEPLLIQKTPAIIEAIKNVLNKGLSPTAINSYNRCSLQFYLSRIAKFEESDDIKPELQSDDLGNIVHHVFQHMFAPYIGKSIAAKDISSMLNDVDTAIQNALDDMGNPDVHSGKNKITFAIAQQHIQRFLNNEKNRLSHDNTNRCVLSVESLMSTSIDVPIEGQLFTMRLHGKADRIDLIDDVVEIIDYKTGSAQKKHVQLPTTIADLSVKSDSDKALQLLTYIMLHRSHSENKYKKYRSMIVALRGSPAEYYLPLTYDKNETHSIENEIEETSLEYFRSIALELLNNERPFVQTDEKKNCVYCSYKNLCNRWPEHYS